MIAYKLENILPYAGTLASPPEMIGPLPEGIGEITGPRIRGKIRPVGTGPTAR